MSYEQEAKEIAEMAKNVDKVIFDKSLIPGTGKNKKLRFLILDESDFSDENKLLSARVQYLDNLIKNYLISDKGQLTQTCIELEKYGVNVIVLERDSFGPLSCGLAYTKNNWCRIFH